jgi:uncharacterized protein (DUF488 family)
MFYRRKIILALLQLFEGQLEKISLQKLLFLFTQLQTEKVYDFVPYKFGCFSYSANADLVAMVGKGLIEETESQYASKEKTDYLKLLKENDRKLLQDIKQQYGKLSYTSLMKHTYINFPYWAINSVSAQNLLNKEQFEKVEKSKPNGSKTILFTIGYEGVSLEDYLNRLIQNDVKILVDVRNNPLSMKFGFSKSQLKRYCESLGIQYLHFPEVGIQSDQRQELRSQSDYDKLFTVYREKTLTQTTKTQNAIFELLKQNKRIALTCFEADINQCHRKQLAESIQLIPGFIYELKHI